MNKKLDKFIKQFKLSSNESAKAHVYKDNAFWFFTIKDNKDGFYTLISISSR